MTGTTPPTATVPPMTSTLKFWLSMLAQLANGLMLTEIVGPGTMGMKVCNLAILVLGGVGIFVQQAAVKRAANGG